MSTTSRVAGAVAAGYALGRFKKLRLAVLVATAMSSPKFRAAAAGMLQDRLPGGAITGTLTKEVGGKLVNVGKTAATSIVTSRIDSLSQSLADRSENLRKSAPGGQAGESRADEPEDDTKSREKPKSPPTNTKSKRAKKPKSPQTNTKSKRTKKPKSPQTNTKSKRTKKPKSPQTNTKSKRTKKPKSPQTNTKSKRTKKPRSPRTNQRSKRHPETSNPKNQ